MRYDRATGSVTPLSGCLRISECAPIGGGPTPRPFRALAAAGEGAVFTAGEIEGSPSDVLVRVELATGDRTVLSGPPWVRAQTSGAQGRCW